MVCLGVDAKFGCVSFSEDDLACSCLIITWLVLIMPSYHDDELVPDVFVGEVIYYGVYCAV